MTSSKVPALAARIERFPIAGSFTISRGAKTEAVTVVAEVSRDGLTGRGECVPYPRYGETPEATLAAIQASCEEFARFAGAQLSFHQSNHEGVLVDLIQSAREEADAIIINPAGYSFTSIALLDALKAFEGPIFEVHISNIHARDELHRHSKLSSAVRAVTAGLGPYGYIVAMQAALHAFGKLPQSLPAPMRLGPR